MAMELVDRKIKENWNTRILQLKAIFRTTSPGNILCILRPRQKNTEIRFVQRKGVQDTLALQG
jgi:hypothetical protein